MGVLLINRRLKVEEKNEKQSSQCRAQLHNSADGVVRPRVRFGRVAYTHLDRLGRPCLALFNLALSSGSSCNLCAGRMSKHRTTAVNFYSPPDRAKMNIM